jgi:hypothetical protein
MEPEGSLPRSQEPSTGPYTEPDRSSPYHPILFLHFNILHSRLGLASGLFPSGLPTNILYDFHFSPILATFHVHLIFLGTLVTIRIITKTQSSVSYFQLLNNYEAQRVPA